MLDAIAAGLDERNPGIATMIRSSHTRATPVPVEALGPWQVVDVTQHLGALQPDGPRGVRQLAQLPQDRTQPLGVRTVTDRHRSPFVVRPRQITSPAARWRRGALPVRDRGTIVR